MSVPRFTKADYLNMVTAIAMVGADSWDDIAPELGKAAGQDHGQTGGNALAKKQKSFA